MAKKDRSIIVKTQDGGAIVEVKNVFLDSSQKDFYITGNIVGEFDDFQYSRFLECEHCEQQEKCKDCSEGDCYEHYYIIGVTDPFGSRYCELCTFEKIKESKMMLLARYNFKFEALYELEKLMNAIESNARTYTFEKRLEEQDLLDIAMKNGVTKEVKTIEFTNRKKTRTYNKTIYSGNANVEIKNHLFFASVREQQLMYGEAPRGYGYELLFRNEKGDFMFGFDL